MKKIVSGLFSLVVLLSCATYAQSYGIVKSYAYYRISTAGNIPVDEAGKPLDNGVRRENLIYVETSGTTTPVWTTAYIDGIPYTIQATEVKNLPVNLGRLRNGNTDILLKKGSRSRLWQLMVTPQQAVQVSERSGGPITLSGTWKGKKFTYKTPAAQELAKILYP